MANETNFYKGTTGDMAFATAGNWSDGAVAAGDNMVVPKNTTATNDVISANVGNSGTLLASFTTERGLSIGMGSFETTVQIDATLAYLAGTGDMFMEIDDCATLTVIEAGSGGAAAEYSLNIFGDGHTGATVIIVDCQSDSEKVAIGPYPGTTRTAYAKEIYVRGGTVLVGEAVAKDAANETEKLFITGGAVNCLASIDDITIEGGTLNMVKGQAADDVEVRDEGTINWLSDGVGGTAIAGDLTVYDGGVIDFSGDLRPKTIAGACRLYPGARLWDPNGVVTFTSGVQVLGGTLDDVDINLGAGRTITVA